MATKVDQVVIRFAGDSGDGMQLIGTQFTNTTALAGNDLATFPDYPAEIRAPAGTREGVSGFQVHFASKSIYTPGDVADVLIAMNPAALVTNLTNLRPGGLIVANTDSFDARDLQKARLDVDPRTDGSLDNFRLVEAPIAQLTKAAVAPHGVSAKDAERCKNFFALGMMYWLYTRDMSQTLDFINKKFKSPYKEANVAAVQAGHAFAETIELFAGENVEVAPAALQKGSYRNIMGNHATALGLAAAAVKAGKPLFYGSYPITPATDILQHLASLKNFGITTYQAEDEIAAVCATIGASYGGSIAVTGTSGPGLALKGEALGLAVMTELPLIVVNVQRGGPSTGLPTKTEQADLNMAMFGRNGESPMAIIAPRSPADCFEVAFEAVRIATKYMVPVMILSDGYVANGAEPWRLPDVDSLPAINITYRTEAEGYLPYGRNPNTLARDWVVPGTPGLEHRIGGLEKDEAGDVCYVPENHEKMCALREEKVMRVQQDIPETVVEGASSGLLLVTWGSTYGAVKTAVDAATAEGRQVAHVHLRWLNPLPADLGDVLRRYDEVVVPEMNRGQLVRMLRHEYLVDAKPLSKVQGLPFTTIEVKAAIDARTTLAATAK